MNRLLLWPHEVDGEGRARLSGRRAEHVREVLRSEEGDTLRAGILNGACSIAQIVAIADGHCDLLLRDDPSAELPPPPATDLLLAMPRPKFLKRILPQLATLGVRRLHLTSAGRVERFYFDTHLLKPEHYLPLIVEGLEQAMDTRLPEVHIVDKHFKSYLRDELAPRYAPGHLLLAHPGPRSDAAAVPQAGEPVLVAIGPEGGWTDPELDLFDALRFTRFSLGPRILRTDMACVAVLTLVDFLRELSGAAGR